MKIILAVCLTLAVSAPLAAQPRPSATPPPGPDEPFVSLRGFVLGAEQQFSAKTTFNAVFGKSAQPFFGGGAQLVFRHGVSIEVSGSQFKKTGQRAFVSNGEAFRLGIPLTATITPIELSVAYRVPIEYHETIIPYIGVGVGWYGYKETSGFTDAGDDVDTRKRGFLGNAGVEIRVHRWVGVALDAQYTHVPGILGEGGLSKDANEKDLGGVAARLRLVVGR